MPDIAVAETVSWAQAHEASFELTPLIEMHEGKKLHVGYTLDLYAELPLEKLGTPERQAVALAALSKLREVVESLHPEGDVRIQVDPGLPGGCLRPANDMDPEVCLSARIYHGHDYFAPVTEAERAQLLRVERALTALGLKRGHW
jgi:hypothetical protein